MAIIGPADACKEPPRQAKGNDHFAGDGAEAHAIAYDMAREQKARLKDNPAEKSEETK